MPRFLRAVALLIGVVVAVVAAACSNDTSSPSAASSTRIPATSPAAGHVPPPPKVGQCRNTPAGPLASDRPPGAPVAHGVGDDWVDETAAIDCSKPHTLETLEVTELAEKPTLALVKQLATSCPSPPGFDYLGISTPSVRDLEFVVYRPSRAQRAAGQSWVRCDVGVRAMTACCQLARQSRSLRGAVAADPVRFYMCTSQVPDPNRSQPLTSCEKPHRGELLPTAIQDDVTTYPSSATLNKKGRSGCAELTAHRNDRADLVVTPFWRPFKADWSGGPLTGFCFIHRTTGPMPPID